MTKRELADLIVKNYTPFGFLCPDTHCKCIEEMGAGEYAQRDTAQRIADFIRNLSVEITDK